MALRALLMLVVLLVACASPQAPGPALSAAELKYRVFDEVGRPWYCDPDFYPIARADEKDLAMQRFPEIEKDVPTYKAILQHNGLAAATTDDQKLVVYRDWKQLNALRLDPVSDTIYGFTVRTQRGQGADQGLSVSGRIHVAGRITIINQQPAGPPICPICLADDARIATPGGELRIVDLREGDFVFTVDPSGSRVAAPVLSVGSTIAPAGHQVELLVLADGRAVRVSPGHPLADGRPAGGLRVGDVVDGSVVAGITRQAYSGRTHDLLPAGPTGAYWANGVLLRSSLRR
jgi:hypothetical protein